MGVTENTGCEVMLTLEVNNRFHMGCMGTDVFCDCKKCMYETDTYKMGKVIEVF